MPFYITAVETVDRRCYVGVPVRARDARQARRRAADAVRRASGVDVLHVYHCERRSRVPRFGSEVTVGDVDAWIPAL